MPLRCIILLFLPLFSIAQPANQLTMAEQQAGWQLLFDGKTTNGWRGAYQHSFPASGWKVANGELRGELTNGAEAGDAGDIVTVNTYRDFDLVFDRSGGPVENRQGGQQWGQILYRRASAQTRWFTGWL